MERRKVGPLGLLAAVAVSQVGNVVALLALPWFVRETTGSAARTGIVAFATTLPLAVGAVAAGPVVDRLGARRAAVLADAGCAAAIAAIPILYAAGRLSFALLVALALTAGACEAPGRTARRAMLPDLASRAGFSLERTSSVSTTTEHLGYVLGAPLAGPQGHWPGRSPRSASVVCSARTRSSRPRRATSRRLAGEVPPVVRDSCRM